MEGGGVILTFFAGVGDGWGMYRVGSGEGGVLVI